MRSFIIFTALLIVLPQARTAEPPPSAGQVDAVYKTLATHCHRCHGQDGTIEGGMNYILDLDKLIARKKIVPGKPDESPLLKRTVAGTMPPQGEKLRPSSEEIAALRKWIADGTPGLAVRPAPTLMTSADVSQKILEDLERRDRRSRRFQRYLNFAHLANAGLSDDELQTYRNALGKLVNSLSWNREIRLPEPIDAAKTIFRIDLRWFTWDATLWNRVLNDYPYGVLDDTATARAIMIGTASKMPVVRGDWFVATASRAPLYYDLLQLPGNLNELERQLRIDAAINIQQDRVARAAFNGSGVSRFNRILERHDGSTGGMYWRTYDFEEPTQNLTERGTLLPDRRNVFAYPLGPGNLETQFQHAGGEVIFALPNGLHAYYICKANNDRIDKAPNAIVSDPKRPDRQVEAGVSCMSCHVTGILPKADQIRDHVDKSTKGFSRADAETIRGIYPGKDVVLAKMEEDMKKYAEAVAKTGAKVSRFEAVSTITLKYEADLDVKSAAAEVGMSAEEFRQKLTTSDILTRNLGALRVAGGTVSRQVWLQTFGDAVRDLRLGTLFAGNTNGGNLTDNTGEIDPLEAQGNVANAAVFTTDGRTAIIASADRSVRIWDVVGKRDVKRLVGHTASVWSVAVTPDGKLAVSGGVDGTARVWDLTPRLETEKFKLEGHAALVSAVAFSPDGKRILTGGHDGGVVWWDADTGKELRRLDGEAKYIHAVVMHPTKKLAAIAADRSIILWNPTTGDIVNKWTAHAAAVTAFSFLDDGQRLASGSDDRAVKIWDIDTATMGKGTTPKATAELRGHDGSIRQIASRADGRWILSSSADGTVKLWNLATRKDVATFHKHPGALLAATFQPSGQSTISIDRELGTLFWDIKKAVVATPSPPPDRIPPAKD